MSKPFKGVIRNWSFLDGRISGTCAFHTEYSNGIAKGEPMTTSRVESIINDNGVITAQTQNSIYVLI